MKIAIDARVLMNEKYSGVSWYACNLLTAMFELDSRNEYVLWYNSHKPIKLPAFNYPNVSYRPYRWPNKAFNFCLNFFSWPKLDKLAGGCDVFFAPNLHFVSWSDNCQKVIVVHDLSFLAYPDFFSFKQQLWHKLILNQKILAQADAIMADSISTRNDLISLLGIAEAKIQVVYPGVSLARASRPNTAVRSKYNLPEKYFLFVGTIEPRKNLSGVIRALEQLPADIALVVVGQWGWKHQEISNFKFSIFKQRVKFLGYVDEADKSALYQGAIALAYPSFYEGFGLPILEAMSLGCPVIAGNNSSQGEVLGEAGLLVDPFNINEIKQAMEIMLDNQLLRDEFINRGLRQAEKFNWQKTAEQALAIFEKLGQEKTSLKQ